MANDTKISALIASGLGPLASIPNTYLPPGAGAIARSIAAKLGETVSVGDYGGVAPTTPNVTFFDGSQTAGLIGNPTLFANNLWDNNVTVSSRAAHFGTAFQQHLTGGGNGTASFFGVALYAATTRTGGSRAQWAFNSVTQVPSGFRNSQSFGYELDFNNNDSDAALTTNAVDQQIGLRIASGGLFKPQVGIQTWAISAASRWRLGGGLANWSDYGLVIVQDPGTATADATGTNFGTAGAAVTGPCILLQPSTDGASPVFRLRNAANTADAFVILQSGATQLGNNTNLQWVGSDAVLRTALFVSGADDLYVMSAKNSGRLTDQSLAQKVTWNTTGLSFFGATPIAKPTVTGSKGANAALTSLMTQLAALGLVTDSTT